MNYLALYRRYRSKTFDEIVGQEHITNTLKNQITSGKIAHAYLLCGIRGIGKTSIAKILAKAVNCLDPKDGNPCLECEMCKNIENSSNMNVIEIDAASNNGVDNVREIKNDVKYMPTEGKYKVYIIDEVHMLSISAFNALLKVLEEPPKHVIFILATTEAQKLPATVLSRCQKYELKRITRDSIANRIKEYLELEEVVLEDKAVKYISSLAEGSMRDALSILEQVISIKKGEQIMLKDVLETLGNVDYSTYFNVTKYINTGKVNELIEVVNSVYDNGKDIRSFIMQYIQYLRNLLLVASSNRTQDILDMSDEDIDDLKKLARDMQVEDIIEYIEEFAKLESEIKYSSMPKLNLEIVLIKLSKSKSGIKIKKVDLDETETVDFEDELDDEDLDDDELEEVYEEESEDELEYEEDEEEADDEEDETSDDTEELDEEDDEETEEEESESEDEETEGLAEDTEDESLETEESDNSDEDPVDDSTKDEEDSDNIPQTEETDENPNEGTYETKEEVISEENALDEEVLTENEEDTEEVVIGDTPKKEEKLSNDELLSRWKSIIENADGALKAMLVQTKALKIENNTYYVIAENDFVRGYLERCAKDLAIQLPLLNGEQFDLKFVIKEQLITKEDKNEMPAKTNMKKIADSLNDKGIKLEFFE